MNTIDYGIGNAIIPFKDVPITINGKIYKDLVAVVRLLNQEEIFRLDKILTDDQIQREIVDEDIVKSCLIDIIGITEPVDLDTASAGFINTIARAIYLQSISYIANSKEYHDRLVSSITLLETMSAIISRFLNLSYNDVVKYPINRIYHLYAVCRAAFPNEVSDIVESSPVKESKIGDND